MLIPILMIGFQNSISCADVVKKTTNVLLLVNQIIYNTKPAAYQMQLTVVKDQLIKEAARIKTYVCEVTLDTEMDEYRLSLYILASTRHIPKDLVATPNPMGKRFSRKVIASVVRDTSLSIATSVLRTHTKSQG
jgi:hypothetical protein